jgi:Na+-transporting NADH:ubiquinone oxidoreductase subunit F
MINPLLRGYTWSSLKIGELKGHIGLIHEVVLDKYLREHPRPESVEYYLCDLPMMIKACTRVLAQLDFPAHQLAYDEFRTGCQ